MASVGSDALCCTHGSTPQKDAIGMRFPLQNRKNIPNFRSERLYFFVFLWYNK